MGRSTRLYARAVEEHLVRLWPGVKTRLERIDRAGPTSPDLGFKTTELGELRSTIRKLSEREIFDRMVAKATYDIQQLEDRRFRAELAATILASRRQFPSARPQP